MGSEDRAWPMSDYLLADGMGGETMTLKAITEKDNLHLEWYEQSRSKEMNSVEQLSSFITELLTEYAHDYGTICHAVVAAGLAAMNVVNEDKKSGGITGFQAQCIMWELINQWDTFGEGPKRMTCYSKLLYPQYEHEFQKTITPSTWKWIQDKAQKNIEESPNAATSVMDHWKRILAGQIPFGYVVREEK